MTKTVRLNDVFSDWFTGAGIFATLQNFNIPWKSENIANDLDLEYHGNLSGDKIISPLVSKISNGETLTNTQKTQIASAIYAINAKNWTKQWATLSLIYNPIENYRMVETMTNDQTVTAYGKTSTRTDNLQHAKTGYDSLGSDITNTRTDNLSHSKSGYDTTDIDYTDTRTDNLGHTKTGVDTVTPNTTETTTPNLTNSSTSTVYGFNSSNAVNANGNSQTATGTNTVTHTGTEQTSYNTSETNTGTQTNVKDETQQINYNSYDTNTGTQTNRQITDNKTNYNISESDTGTQSTTDGGNDTSTRNYELERSGNIGVTTSQQMLKSERNLWIWNFFRNVVFPDIDRVLTVQIY